MLGVELRVVGLRAGLMPKLGSGSIRLRGGSCLRKGVGIVPLDFSGNWELAEGGFLLVFCGAAIMLFGAVIGAQEGDNGKREDPQGRPGKILKGCMREKIEKTSVYATACGCQKQVAEL